MRVPFAFVVTVDDGGVWSAAQIEGPALSMAPSGMSGSVSGPWIHEQPLNLGCQGMSIHYRNRLNSFEDALAFLRERVAGEAAKLLGTRPGGQP